MHPPRKSFRQRWPMRLAAAATVLLGFACFAIAQTETPVPVNPIEPTAAPLASEGSIPTKNMLQVVKDGGPLMIPIAICSIVLLVFVFERAISLRKGRVAPGPFVKRFLGQLRDKQLTRETALELCEENRSPASDVFAAAVKKWGRPAVEVEQAIIDAGERVTHGLRRYLRLLNGVSTISPLLGLLGTVLGMISAFNAIASADAMGRPELLAGGISQALLTTAAGLSVAIPALIAYLFFVGRVDRLIIEIDSYAQEVVDIISAEALSAPASESRSSRAKAADAKATEVKATEVKAKTPRSKSAAA
ncbi:MotA/TolQ/ExbB proton channel family protein [Lignipirellula cremea]|nr:MotA/TolQ/ExbB proton channel family protein [Lignipirellula cremea]